MNAPVVIDASAAVELLARTDRGSALRALLPERSIPWVPDGGTADVVDAHVVICARRAHQRVVSSDPEDLRRLDPTIEIFRV